MKKFLLAISGATFLGLTPSASVAQMLYMNPSSGMIYDGYGIPQTGPSPSRVMNYQRQQMMPHTRRSIYSDGSIRNGYGSMLSGPDPMRALCLQNPLIC